MHFISGDLNILVGYWPGTLLNIMKDYADLVQWGGEVTSRKPDNGWLFSSHTRTAMGSGQFPEGGYGQASFMRHLQIVDENKNLGPVKEIQLDRTDPRCYNITMGTTDDLTDWGTHFYYGGPGLNPYCEY